MKITYPHMGNACIAIEAMLQKLKLEVIPPSHKQEKPWKSEPSTVRNLPVCR